MDGISVVLALLVGLGAGAALGWALARSRDAGAEARARAAEERAAYLEEHLEERFRSLAALALDGANQRFLELAEGRFRAARLAAESDLDHRREAIEHLLAPLRHTLSRVEEQLREVDAGRRAAHAELVKQVELVREGSERLRDQTDALVTALRRPEARGRWGELHLRRAAELAGMAAHCDFEEQAHAATDDGVLRPDMVVRLAGGKNVVVDSKVAFLGYLEAQQAAEPAVREARLDAHVRHMVKHVDDLASKRYWSQFSPAPEFVVMFVPADPFLAAAVERRADLRLEQGGLAVVDVAGGADDHGACSC